MSMVVQSLHMIAVLVFPAALIYGACSDLKSYRIPNWLSLALIATFPVAALTAGLGWDEVLMRLAAAGVIFAVGLAMFAFGLLGGGDVKIMAAAGLWVGWSLMGPFLLITALGGGVLALALLIVRSNAVAPKLSGVPGIAHLLVKDEGIPYGVAIAVAGGVVFYRALMTERLFNVSFF